MFRAVFASAMSVVLIVAILQAAQAELVSAAPAPVQANRTPLVPPKGKYDVRILRDTWGVPHIYGKTDADVAYGLAYAHCEDDFENIQEAMFMVRGLLASIKGPSSVPIDYMVKLFRFEEIVAERYEKDLSPQTQAICNAAADGYNHYAALHPKQTLPGVLPARGQDIVTGFCARLPYFFGVPSAVQSLLEKRGPARVSSKATAIRGGFAGDDLPTGSNTFAIAPSRTPDGKVHLAINSHQPWTGPAAWYEARLKSEEGWDMVGGLFPGSPIVLVGHNPDLGWAHTNNSPDLVDVYVLEINPDNRMQYKFDGKWLDIEVKDVEIKVKTIGDRTMTLTQRARYSVYGPVIRQLHGTYGIRFAGQGNIRAVEQWYRMNKARTIKQFEEAMRIQAIPFFNVGYADKKGNIWYIYNALLPIRAEGYDWKNMIPGNTSKTLWTKYLPLEKLPQVRNPKCGFIQSCNSTPFQTSIGPENPNPDHYSTTFGIEPASFMMNRSTRMLELLGADTSITEEEFYAYKYDMKYSRNSVAGQVLKEVLAAPSSDDPLVREAIEILRRWDGSTDPNNTGAAIAVLSLEPIVRDRMFGHQGGNPMRLVREKALLLKDTFGRIDVPWKQVNRLVRGKVDLGLGGGPDILHAVYGHWQDGRLVGEAGDGYVLMVTWDRQEKVHSRSIHQFGSATCVPSSPHYADQAPLFVQRKTKPVWLDEKELRQHLKVEYRPGER